MTLPTSHGTQTPEQVRASLIYMSYAHNRNNGMSPEGAARVYARSQPARLEQRYQAELAAARRARKKADAAGEPAMAGHRVGEHYRPADAPISHAQRAPH